MKMNLFFAVVVGVMLTNLVFAGTEVVNPRVNNRVEPVGVEIGSQTRYLGIDEGSPSSRSRPEDWNSYDYERPHILFSWNLKDATPDTMQTAYKIFVSPEATLDPDAQVWITDARWSDQDIESNDIKSNSPYWTTGWVESARCLGIPYLGPELKSSTKYYWTVQVKNNRGEISQLEKPASFIMGIQSQEHRNTTVRFASNPEEPSSDREFSSNRSAYDWKATWISMDRTDKDPLPIFRKPFDIDPAKKIETAVVHICGLGHFELNLNGEKVGDHFIDPGWTNYRKTCLYVSFDLTDSLKSGENVFGVLLGNGMYNVPGGRYVKYTGSFGPPKMVCQLHVKYTDGSEQLVCSDESWKASLGPIVFSCVYGGEDVDNRRLENGWDKPGFDDTHWSSAKILGWAEDIAFESESVDFVLSFGPDQQAIDIGSIERTRETPVGTRLRSQEAPPITVAETKKPESLKRLPDGRYVADFGYNFSGRPRVVLKGKAGQTATVKTAEIINRIWDGHSYTITLNGEGEELLLPKFTYFGFQFLYIEGAVLEKDRTEADADKPMLVSMEADFTTSSVEKVGAFECSDELLNEIDAMIDRSVRSNLASVLTDCPHREKLGWLEVPHLMGPSIMSRYDVHNLYRKICLDMLESQIEDGPQKGLVPDISPEYTRFEAGFFASPEWGSACIQIPWLLFRYYGDTDIFLSHRNAQTDKTDNRVIEMQRGYMDYLDSTRKENQQGLVKAGLGDWYDWSEEKGHAGYSQHTPGELTSTAVFLDNLRILHRLSDTNGLNFDRRLSSTINWDHYQKLYDEALKNYKAAYLNSETGTVATGSQSALAETLYVLGKDDAILDQLVKKIEADRYKPTVGEVSFPKLIRALVAGGRNDILWKMIHRTDKPGYGYMLKKCGMKTLSETWDGPGSSMNHCMFGHIQEWFTGTIVGINLADSRILEEAFSSTSKVKVPQFVLNPTPVGDSGDALTRDADALTWAKGHYDSVYGRVESSWKIENGTFFYSFTIPANTTAIVRLPNGEQRDYGSGTHELKVK